MQFEALMLINPDIKDDDPIVKSLLTPEITMFRTFLFGIILMVQLAPDTTRSNVLDSPTDRFVFASLIVTTGNPPL